jgi:hypothetical protein
MSERPGKDGNRSSQRQKRKTPGRRGDQGFLCFLESAFRREGSALTPHLLRANSQTKSESGRSALGLRESIRDGIPFRKSWHAFLHGCVRAGPHLGFVSLRCLAWLGLAWLGLAWLARVRGSLWRVRFGSSAARHRRFSALLWLVLLACSSGLFFWPAPLALAYAPVPVGFRSSRGTARARVRVARPTQSWLSTATDFTRSALAPRADSAPPLPSGPLGSPRGQRANALCFRVGAAHYAFVLGVFPLFVVFANRSIQMLAAEQRADLRSVRVLQTA